MAYNTSFGYKRLNQGTPSGTPSEQGIYGRVVDVILDQFHPKYKQYGQSQAINGVFYREVSRSLIEDEEQDLKFAFQGNSTVRYVPLKNEIVQIAFQPSYDRSISADAKTAYWTSIIPVWNHPHHNASPDSVQFKDQLEATGEVDLGANFEEKSDINPLQPFPGDFLIEGRQGQSIRFTGTKYPSNPFVDSSNNNKPIILISNGQVPTEVGYESILEDINQDASSLYFVSDHQVPLISSNVKQDAFNIRPVQYSEYKGNQVLLNSGRLIFNSKENDILFSAKENFAVTSNILGLDSKEYIGLDSKKIYLGIKARRFEDEPVLLGNTTKDWLVQLVNELETLLSILSTLPPAPSAAVAQLIGQGNASLPVIRQLKSKISTLSSKKVFTE